MAPRAWLRGSHCLWPLLHTAHHEKGQNGAQEFWVCNYCHKMFDRYEIVGTDQNDPTRFFAREKATGRLWRLNGRESLYQKGALMSPSEFLKAFR